MNVRLERYFTGKELVKTEVYVTKAENTTWDWHKTIDENEGGTVDLADIIGLIKLVEKAGLEGETITYSMHQINDETTEEEDNYND